MEITFPNIFFSWNPHIDIDNILSRCKCINLMDVHRDKSVKRDI